MLLSVILYGSRARGDHRPKSDVDLLGVIENGPLRREVTAGGTSLYHYPSKLIEAQSLAGNLFVLHLVSEGVVLHDTLGFFKRVKDSFVYKEQYSNEVIDGSTILRFFLARPELLRRKSARKRLIWSIRTILIARNAESGRPCFSSAALASSSKISGLKDVIDDRNQNIIPEMLVVSKKVLDRYGEPSLVDTWPNDRTAQRQLMKSRGGIVEDTLRFIQPIRLVKGKPIAVVRASDDLTEHLYPD